MGTTCCGWDTTYWGCAATTTWGCAATYCGCAATYCGWYGMGYAGAGAGPPLPLPNSPFKPPRKPACCAAFRPRPAAAACDAAGGNNHSNMPHVVAVDNMTMKNLFCCKQRSQAEARTISGPHCFGKRPPTGSSMTDKTVCMHRLYYVAAVVSFTCQHHCDRHKQCSPCHRVPCAAARNTPCEAS